ncbi:MAG: hypothetical protein HUU25_04005 [Candidatus Sumerlaeia bacterium]|nr:hypothetical protein [Candidatus Sumerlaeia bacterium]
MTRGAQNLPLSRAVPVALGLGLAVACASMIQRGDLVGLTGGTPPAESCAECHVAIHREWAASAHARAFTDPTFQEATVNARARSCVACHVPVTVFHIQGDPEARTDRLDEGVSCVVCHLDTDDHALAGPLTGLGPLVPHATVEGDTWFRSSELCGVCHEGTFSQTQAHAARVGDRRTCQECHMPAVDRKTTQATDVLSSAIVALHDTHPSRRHTFEIGAVENFPDTLAVRVLSPTRVEVTNLLPHPIPTGDFGHRVATLTATRLDSDGRPLASVSRRFTRHEGEAMEPGERVTLDLGPAPETPHEVAITLTREGASEEGVCVIASLRVPVSSASTESAP